MAANVPEAPNKEGASNPHAGRPEPYIHQAEEITYIIRKEWVGPFELFQHKYGMSAVVYLILALI